MLQRRQLGMAIVFMGLAFIIWPMGRGWGQETSAEPADADAKKKDVFAGLTLRDRAGMHVGGMSDIAIDPVKRSTWYVVAASGGVWKTTNSGTTWSPIFDGYGSYSIGCVAVDPGITWSSG